MRDGPGIGKLCLSLIGFGIAVIAGCQSTTVGPALSRKANDPAPGLAEHKSATPQGNGILVDGIVWRKAGAANDSVRPVGFEPKPLPKGEASLLDLIPKSKPEAKPQRVVAAQPVAFRHGGKHAANAGVPIDMPIPNAPNEQSLAVLPTYTLRPPDVLLIESQKGLLTQPIRGQHLVRPDGTVGLGIYGPALVVGRNIQQAREEIARVIHARLDAKAVKVEDVLDGLSVDVLAYNSSVYYIITDGAGLGEQVYRFPVTGSDTVLDAISHINGLPVMASPKRIWVARKNAGPAGPMMHDTMLPVDWKGITQFGAMNTNWQVMPGDRIYVQADPVRRFNNTLSKYLEPIERLMGSTLLGAQTINAIKGNTGGVGR